MLPLLLALTAFGCTPAGATCVGDKVAFDGACRGLAYFQNLAPDDATVLGVAGCKSVGDCSHVILFEEIKVTFKLRALVLSESGGGSTSRGSHPIAAKVVRSFDGGRTEHFLGLAHDLGQSPGGETTTTKVFDDGATVWSAAWRRQGPGFYTEVDAGAKPTRTETLPNAQAASGLVTRQALADVVDGAPARLVAHAAGAEALPNTWRLVEGPAGERWQLSLHGQDFW